VDILDKDVIKPLTTLRESRDQLRKGIEKELKKSAAARGYADHAENTISKLQQAYLKKYYPQEPAKPAKSEEAFDDDCREAVSHLNNLRLRRAEDLEEGYDCLQDLVFTPTIKDVLVKYMDGMITACAKYDDLAKSTRAKVEKALAGTDTSDLRASFRGALSFSTPPLTLYRDYRPDAYSKLIFGVPLVDLETNEANVPKVMRMCIEAVEKRGLNTKNIYSVGSIADAEVLQFRRRFESEKTFSFSSTDNVHHIAMLHLRYLGDLPERLFTLSFQEFRDYEKNRG